MDNSRGRPAIRPSVRGVTEWEVPGYVGAELLGFGSSGEVWRARDRSTGALVALRRLAGGDREAVATLRKSATTIRSLPAEHLVRLRTTTRAGGDDVLVLDFAAGGSLEALLARRGRLAPGEVVTAVAPLADVLAQAHAQGLAHGRVRASSVLLTADGKPLLDGLGRSCLHDADDTLDPTGALGAAADVWALAALAHLLLTGVEPSAGTSAEALAPLVATAPLPLVQAIEGALAFDPSARPTASDLAAALLASCSALPLSGVVASVPAVPTPAPRFARPAALPRRGLVAAGCLVVGLAVVSLGWAWGAAGAPRGATVLAVSPVSPVMARPSTDWRSVLQGLDAARAAAFLHGDPSRLSQVYATGSASLAADARLLESLARVGRRAVGVEHSVTSLTPVRLTADRAQLQVVEALNGYSVEDVSGRVVERRAAGPGTRVLIELVQTTAGWRVAQVRRSA